MVSKLLYALFGLIQIPLDPNFSFLEVAVRNVLVVTSDRVSDQTHVVFSVSEFREFDPDLELLLESFSNILVGVVLDFSFSGFDLLLSFLLGLSHGDSPLQYLGSGNDLDLAGGEVLDHLWHSHLVVQHADLGRSLHVEWVERFGPLRVFSSNGGKSGLDGLAVLVFDGDLALLLSQLLDEVVKGEVRVILFKIAGSLFEDELTHTGELDLPIRIVPLGVNVPTLFFESKSSNFLSLKALGG